jgi:hypothetical protein
MDPEDSCPTRLIAQRSLENTKNYIQDPAGTLAHRILPPSPAAGVHPEPLPPTTGRPELHCFKAFKRAAVDARLQGRAEAIVGGPSAGDTPQAPGTLETDRLATTAAVPREIDPLHLSGESRILS